MITESVKIELPFQACLECPMKEIKQQLDVYNDGIMYRHVREELRCKNEMICNNAVMRYLSYDENGGQHDS